MPNYKNIIPVKPEEKRLGRIMKELQESGESVISNFDEDWHGTMREFGKRARTLFEIKRDDDRFLEKPWVQIDTHHHTVKSKMIRVKNKAKTIVEIEKKPRKNDVIYIFKRRRLI